MNNDTNGMKVISLQAKNTMNLSAIEIIPEGNTIVLTGKNGAGKSNILKAMEFALSGKALAATPEPVKHGEKSGDIILDLGDIIVKRHFTNDTSTLKIANAEGMIFNSPQALLDKFRGNISFDPLEFAGLPEKQQKEILLGMIDLPIDLDELDTQRKQTYDQRTDVNRDIKRLEGQRDGIPNLPDVPDDEISAVDVMAEMQAATEQIAANNNIRNKLRAAVTQCSTLANDVRRVELELEDKKRELAVQEKFKIELDLATRTLIDPDLEVFKCKLEDVEQINAHVRKKNELKGICTQINDLKGVSLGLTVDMTAIDTLKTKTISEAGMPVVGLGFNESGVTFEEIPLSQRSSAEQRKISMSIGMAMNPDLKVLWLKDASLLDSDSIEDVKTMADENGYQIWLECVGEDKDVGIFIEGGAVVT